MVTVNTSEPDKDFESLYKKYYRKIYGYIRKHLLNQEISEDLTANVFINALKFIQAKNPQIGNFNAWIYRIASNELIRYWKQRERQRKLENLSRHETDAEEELKDYEDFKILHDAVLSLNSREQIVISLHFYEKLSYAEISQILNETETSLRSVLFRALKKIRNRVGDSFEDRFDEK